jgi:hypothetical protein
MKITFLGNFGVSYSSENHHVKTLESLGHEVICLQEGKVDGNEIVKQALTSDLFVVVHTHGWVTPILPLSDVLRLLKGKVTTLTYHLDLWFGIDRQKDLETDDFYKLIDHFFCTDKLMADWFNDNTKVKGHFLPAGVYHEETYLLDLPKTNDVIFVGSKGYHNEWKWRPQLIDWLYQAYGDRFKHYGNDGLGVVRGDDLNRLYASTKIVVGDTLCLNFNYPYYLSDRVFETTGRGGFLLMPYIKGIEDLFKVGKEIITFKFGDFKDLKSKIDYYLEHDDEREEIRIAGFERTKKDHNYKNRWITILDEIK